MISDKLYSLAFQFKKTKLWETLWDTCIFAVKLSGERVGFISIMGAAQEHYALGLYIGEDGFDSLRELAETDSFMMTPFQFQERLMQQNCLQCAFEGKDILSEEEREEVKQYARSHKIRLAGKHAYPQFVKYQANCYPWYLQTEQEQEDLCEALAAAVELAGRLKEKRPDELGLRTVTETTKKALMLERGEEGYVLGEAAIPEKREKKWPAPEVCNDISIARLKKMKRAGVWECEIIRYHEPIQNTPEEIPVFPVFFLAVEASDGYVLPVSLTAHYEENPEELLEQFIDGLLQHKICPAELKVRDQRTYSFAKAFCGKLKIPVRIEPKLPALDEAEISLLEHFQMGEEAPGNIMDILDDMLQMDDEERSQLPKELWEQLELLADEKCLSDEEEKKVNQLLRRGDHSGTDAKVPGRSKKKAKAAKGLSNQSYIISVSLGTGCYRHIQISGSSTLFQLHTAILDAFDFMDDHAHAFFMDNHAWSDWDCYYAAGLEKEDRTTDRYRLDQIGLYQDKKFKYIFDFGDEWTFQCKVLRIAEEKTPKPLVIRSKGVSPEQYGGW